MMNIPIYQAKINENDESLGLQCISLVNDPAVEVQFIKFSEQKQQLKFSVDHSHRTISGVALRADYPIYRIGPSGEEYYIVFSKDVIEQLVKKYSKENLQNSVSINHDGKQINGVYMYEQFLINKDRGICPKEFEDIEDGSWITSYYINDDQLWEDLQNENNLSGFSVEVALELTSEKLTYNYKNKLKDMDIKKIFATILKLGKYEADGVVLIYEGNELVEGTEVFIEDAEGNIIPAPDGQYGEYTVIGGIITTPEKVEEEIEEMKEEAKEAKLEEVIEESPEIDEKDQIIEDLKSQIEALIAENEELKKQLEEANKATEELKKQSLSAEESLKNIETEKAKSNKFSRYFE